MLLLAVFHGLPYTYFRILRWVIVIVGAINAYQEYESGKTGWMWIMIVISILFNPIAPIYLTKSTWSIIDVITAVFMFSYISTNKNEKLD